MSFVYNKFHIKNVKTVLEENQDLRLVLNRIKKYAV
jgi:hypothetical protein